MRHQSRKSIPVSKTALKDVRAMRKMASADFTAAIPADQIEELERDAADPERGIARRMALALACRDKAFLMRDRPHSTEHVKMYLEVAEKLSGYERHLKAVLEVVNAARNRAFVLAATVGCERAKHVARTRP